ncbi:hypothetical protein [Methylobacterium sp. 285MFTsu5.1]|uniref:hypothetical protein n=1 Tax=Methylobacterium sp. 285MFTsu5.1 TaxID=1172187 RepID=UPI00039FEBA1|nr:hypothetical protein [Methylobacterium sp. 285MFTsu5.1]
MKRFHVSASFIALTVGATHAEMRPPFTNPGGVVRSFQPGVTLPSPTFTGVTTINGTISSFRAGGDGFWAFGRVRTKPGQGLCIGGGSIDEGSACTLLGNDGSPNWLRVITSQEFNPTEIVLYSAAAQGKAQTVQGTNRVTWIDNTPFSTAGDWPGRKLWFGDKAYLIVSVASPNSLTVKNIDGSAVSFASNATDTYHVVFTSGEGTASVTGTTVKRLQGAPFATPNPNNPDEGMRINGLLYKVSAVPNGDTMILQQAPGNHSSVTYKYFANVNDQLTTLRVQKVAGTNEENLSIYTRPDGYHIRSLISGTGKFWPMVLGNGGGGGRLYEQVVLNVDGSLSIGDRPGGDSVRIYSGSAPGQAAANRFELSGGNTGTGPVIRSRGSDANVPMAIDLQGSGDLKVSGNTFGQTLLQIYGTTGTGRLAFPGIFNNSADTGLQANGAAANIDVRLVPKGASGRVALEGPARLRVYTVAGLPTCNSALQDTLSAVSDATAPTYRGALTGGGTVRLPVYCDGFAWTAH